MTPHGQTIIGMRQPSIWPPGAGRTMLAIRTLLPRALGIPLGVLTACRSAPRGVRISLARVGVSEPTGVLMRDSFQRRYPAMTLDSISGSGCDGGTGGSSPR
jgi:hypothetical protein